MNVCRASQPTGSDSTSQKPLQSAYLELMFESGERFGSSSESTWSEYVLFKRLLFGRSAIWSSLRLCGDYSKTAMTQVGIVDRREWSWHSKWIMLLPGPAETKPSIRSFQRPTISWSKMTSVDIRLLRMSSTLTDSQFLIQYQYWIITYAFIHFHWLTE